MAVSPAIEKLFNEYAAAFDKLDFEKQAQYFSNAFIMAGPKGAVSCNKQEFLQNAQQAVAFYKSVGQQGAKMMSITQTDISNEYALVKTHWVVRFEKTGDTPIEFDMSYIVHTALPQPEIILALAHEDEAEAMKKLGLIADKK